LAPKQIRRNYTGSEIDVSFDIARCIHAAECLRGLPAVFDRFRRPWILTDAGEADQVADVVRRCPSGALRYESGDSERPSVPNLITVAPYGPLYVRGKIAITSEDGEVLHRDIRSSLCRCGASENKPFCDNSHVRIGFVTKEPKIGPQLDGLQEGELKITPSRNGPLELHGSYELRSPDGGLIGRGDTTRLCRCGSSAEMPFCDDSHREVDFVAEVW
jgi:CDGSH-type Zn-finger protein/uncharacterized Fe-S cluster protein YjdI